MGGSPARFCENFAPSKNRFWLKDFKYRFQTRDDLVALVKAIGAVRSEYGSLKALFLAKDDQKSETIFPGIGGMAEELRRKGRRSSTGMKYLLSDPSKESASKRWNLYMRWMVRRDQLDPGPWSTEVSKARLVIPLDTHVARIARLLGLLTRKSSDKKAALELTRNLRLMDPKDPVKYDFAICSFGKLGYCVRKIDIERCKSCDLSVVCKKTF